MLGGWQVSFLFRAQSGAPLGFGNFLFAQGMTVDDIVLSGDRAIGRSLVQRRRLQPGDGPAAGVERAHAAERDSAKSAGPGYAVLDLGFLKNVELRRAGCGAAVARGGLQRAEPRQPGRTEHDADEHRVRDDHGAERTATADSARRAADVLASYSLWLPPSGGSHTFLLRKSHRSSAEATLFSKHYNGATMRRHHTFVLTVALFFAIAIPGTTQAPPGESGAVAAWLKLLKLKTTASAMHTTAHPDDEHGGMLTMLSRRDGARVSLLTLTRGESGDNAIGPELFDALGLIRSEELLMSGRYYGLDRQYFATVVDYGYSKRLDETLERWGKDYVLRDMVGAIRTDRPLVVISRFQGNERDGHGNHSAAGLISQEAFKLAGDPQAFPEQIASGLRPWQPLKLYIGGGRANEDWTIRVDAGEYDPILGESYQSISRLGLSFQRSQNSGRVSPQPGPSLGYYKRLQSMVEAPAKEQTFFDGIDTSITGLPRVFRKSGSSEVAASLAAIEQHIKTAVSSFTFADPSASAPALARALAATRSMLTDKGLDPDLAFVLHIKCEQIEDAIHAALGISLSAMAQPAGTPEATGPFAAGSPDMPPVVPGQTFEVRTAFTNRSQRTVSAVRMSLEAAPGWKVDRTPSAATDAASNQPIVQKFPLAVPEDAELTRPYFSRRSIQDSTYVVSSSQGYRPHAPSALYASARYEIDGVPVEIRRPVTRAEANLPYGYDIRMLAVVPAVAVTMTPSRAIVPLGAPSKSATVTVDLLNNRAGGSDGTVRLNVPAAWKVTPASRSFRFARAGERAQYNFTVSIPSLNTDEYRVEAIASSGGREYRVGYDIIRHRDLETRYLYRDAVTTVRGIDVKTTTGLTVGYVMGIGDDVPSGLAQLGAKVQLLGAQELATADLSRFNTIITGTRAYAVREDLKTYNSRLIDYVRDGGNLIVLYNTQEFTIRRSSRRIPASCPALPKKCPRKTRRSRSSRPTRRYSTPLTGSRRLISTIGSNSAAPSSGRAGMPQYTPIIAMWDRGQAPQKGGWLHARYGKGHYTYFAYAFHRQLPYAVPGAYRLLANLLALNAANQASK